MRRSVHATSISCAVSHTHAQVPARTRIHTHAHRGSRAGIFSQSLLQRSLGEFAAWHRAVAFVNNRCLAMAAAEESDQQSLAALWTSARRGCLTPWSEAKVWALREVYLEHGPGKSHGLNAWVA